jgi:hypothetical protein
MEVLRGTPGVDEVEYCATQGSRPLKLTGIKAPDQVHRFIYRGTANVEGVLQFVVDYEGTVQFSQTLLALGQPPRQERVDATRPIMLQIETRLEQCCGPANLRSSVKETCFRVKCA